MLITCNTCMVDTACSHLPGLPQKASVHDFVPDLMRHALFVLYAEYSMPAGIDGHAMR